VDDANRAQASNNREAKDRIRAKMADAVSADNRALNPALGKKLGARNPPCVTDEISNRELRDLKAKGQLLRPVVFIGKEGLSAALIKSLDEALGHHELVKVKFADFKEEKKLLTPQLAEKVSAQVVMRVGNVAVFFRRKPVPPAKSPG